MTVAVRIEGGNNEAKVKVTPSGELVVGPLSYDETVFNELDTVDVGVNFYEPLPGKQFVMTGVLFRADKQVSSTVDATVVVYEAGDTATATVDKVLIQFAVVQGDIINATSLNLLVGVGKFVNAKTDDDDIHMTIMGYYIDKL